MGLGPSMKKSIYLLLLLPALLLLHSCKKEDLTATTDITAKKVGLQADKGIGTAADPIEIKADVLAANTTTGSIAIVDQTPGLVCAGHGAGRRHGDQASAMPPSGRWARACMCH